MGFHRRREPGALRTDRKRGPANFAKLPLNDGTKLFCPKEPLGERLGVDKYAHNHYGDPNWPGPLPPGTTKRQLAAEFARW